MAICPPAASSERRRRLHRGRPFVLWSLAGCLGVQLLGIWPVATWPVLRDPVHYSRVNYLRQRQADTPAAQQVVFFGSSRVQWGLQVPPVETAAAAQLGRLVVVHNWGTAGMPLPAFLLTWDRMERDGVRPDLIVLEVMPAHLLSKDVTANVGKERFPPERMDARDVAVLERAFGPWDGMRREQFLAALNPWYAQRMTILNGCGGRAFLPQKNVIDMTPFAGVRVSIDPAKKPAYAADRRATYQPMTQEPLTVTPVVQALEQLIDRITAAGVPVALLLMPEGPDFRAMYPPGRQEEVMRYITDMATSRRIPVLDAWRWYDTEDPFLDSHHLLAEAADEFSDRLGRELLAPLLANQNR